MKTLFLVCLFFALTQAISESVLSAANGTVVFAEDFEEGNLNQWLVQACPEGVTISSTYARTGTHSAKFTVNDGDTHAKCVLFFY